MPEDCEFSDRAPGIKEYPIEIVILREGEPLGADRGFAWFEEGLLHFNGAATSFTLAAEDIVPRKKVGKRAPYRNLPSDSIRLARPGPSAAVRLLPLNGFRRWGFWYVLGRFLSARMDVGKSRQWPPVHKFGESMDDPIRPRSIAEIGKAAARDGVSQGVVKAAKA